MSRELVIHRHYTANGCSNSLQIICFIHLYNLPIKISPSLSKIIPVLLSFSFSLHNWLRKNTFIGSLFLCSRFEWCVIRVPWSDSLYHCCTPGTWDLYHLLTSIVSLLPSCVQFLTGSQPWQHNAHTADKLELYLLHHGILHILPVAPFFLQANYFVSKWELMTI